MEALAAHAVVVRLATGQSVGQAMAKIGIRPGVAFVEPDYRLTIAATPDDPHYRGGDQWGMYGHATSPHADPFGTGAATAWAEGHVGAASVFVGVVDEGIQVTHPDLVADIWTNPWESADGLDEMAAATGTTSMAGTSSTTMPRSTTPELTSTGPTSPVPSGRAVATASAWPA